MTDGYTLIDPCVDAILAGFLLGFGSAFVLSFLGIVAYFVILNRQSWSQDG